MTKFFNLFSSVKQLKVFKNNTQNCNVLAKISVQYYQSVSIFSTELSTNVSGHPHRSDRRNSEVAGFRPEEWG
jgi:hypothetical protein